MDAYQIVTDKIVEQMGWEQGGSVVHATADTLLNRTAGSLARALQCTVRSVSVDGNTLIVNLEDE